MKKQNSANPVAVPEHTDIEADQFDFSTFQHIMNSMPDIVFYRFNMIDNTCEYISPSCKEVFGLPAEEFRRFKITQLVQEFVHPEDQMRLREALMCLLQMETESESKSIVIEHRFKCNGSYHWMNQTMRVSFDPNGIPSALIGCCRDIEETMRLRQALNFNQQRLKQIYNNARIALFRSTKSGDRLLECNDLFAWMMGFGTAGECVENFTFRKQAVSSASLEKFLANLRDPDATNNHEIQIRRKNGANCWMRIFGIWCDDEQFGGSALDITACKALSDTEVQILKLLLAGLSNKEVANRIHRSRRTIEQHRASIMKKLDAQNVVQLANHYLSIIL